MESTVSFANAWIISVDAARRRLPGYAAFLIAVAALAAATLGGGALYRSLPDPRSWLGSGLFGLTVDRAIQYLCILALLYAAALAFGGGYESRSAPQACVRRLLAGLAGLGLGFAGFAIALGLCAALGAVRFGAETLGMPQRLAGALIGAALIAFQAGGEELFFRGWLQPVLAARWGPWIGLCVTSLLFAAAHAVGRPVGAVALVNDALAGALFGMLAFRTGGLWAPFAAHWAWNWAEQSVAGATPNPGVDPLGSLFDLDLVGSGILGGGADELNGAAGATVALVLMLVLVGLWRPVQQPARQA